MKTPYRKQTFHKFSVQWFENYIALRRLAFDRAMDVFDIDRAQIVCGQIEWAERRLAWLLGCPFEIRKRAQ